MASNFENLLDDALNQSIDISPTGPARQETPEIAGLVSVARQVTVLEAVPPIHLSEGRRKFLNEAERVLARRAQHRWRRGWMEPRPAWLVTMAVIVLFAGAAFTLIVMSGMLDNHSPSVPIMATPGMSPTYTATPTRMVRLSPDNIPLPSIATSHGQLCTPEPKPVPEPVPPESSTLRSISELVSYKCLKL